MLAVADVARFAPEPLGPDVAAQVNERRISLEDWQRAIAAVNSSRRQPLDSAAEAALLDTLIQEELLLQLAQDLDLSHGLPEVRGRLVRAAMDSLLPAQESLVADASTLAAFARAQPELFAQPERRQLRLTRHPSPEEAEGTQGGEAVDLPAEALSANQAQRWLGQSLTEAAFSHPQTGLLPKPLLVGQGWYRVEVLRILPAGPVDADSLDPDLLQSIWQRQQREQALAAALDGLMQQADIQRRAHP